MDIPEDILDSIILCKMHSEPCRKVMWAILKETILKDNQFCTISYGELIKMTNLCISQVSRAVNFLIKNNYITRNNDWGEYQYYFNPDHTQWTNRGKRPVNNIKSIPISFIPLLYKEEHKSRDAYELATERFISKLNHGDNDFVTPTIKALSDKDPNDVIKHLKILLLLESYRFNIVKDIKLVNHILDNYNHIDTANMLIVICNYLKKKKSINMRLSIKNLFKKGVNLQL